MPPRAYTDELMQDKLSRMGMAIPEEYTDENAAVDGDNKIQPKNPEAISQQLLLVAPFAGRRIQGQTRGV